MKLESEEKMKRLFAAVLTACLLAGCSSSAGTSASSSQTAGEVKFANSGTYSATAAGRNGEIKVTAEFSENEILSIETESQETENIGVKAMNELKEEILSSQAVDVDAKTSATISSEAFLTALKDCIVQAGGDPEKLTGAASASAGTEIRTEADVIVVGGGAAGMTAAITAKEDGADVILIEKSGVLGGNTVCAANGINAADSKVQLNNDTYKEKGGSVEGLEKLQMNNDDAKENLVKAFAENSGEVIDWLSGIGASFEVDIQEDERNPEQNYYMLKDTTDGTTAVSLINRVSAELEKQGITLYYNMDAYELVTDETGTVTGVKAKDADGNDVVFSAKAVLLATGGFGQNSELVGKVNPALANAVTDEIAPTTGEGLLMAQAVGADAVNLDSIQTFPAVIPGYGMILPFNLPGGFVPDALYVNNQAQRFTAEGFEIPDAILAQDKGEVFCIFDESGMNDGMKTLLNNGIVVSGENASELAEKLGLDGAALQASIDAFNEDIADGTDDAFGRAENLNPIEGTLYGYRFGVGAHYFMGGLLIDEKTHVLNTEGKPISGLYAAGEVTGGFHGTFRVDGSGLGDSFTFGRIAGHTLAEENK